MYVNSETLSHTCGLVGLGGTLKRNTQQASSPKILFDGDGRSRNNPECWRAYLDIVNDSVDEELGRPSHHQVLLLAGDKVAVD